MARRNRSNQLELNFDGLADSVTNLVGALILLVVMVIGITKDVAGDAGPPQPEPHAGEDGAEKPMLPLKQRIALLEAQVGQVDASINQLNGRLQPLKQEIEELLESLDAVQPPPKKNEEKPRDKVTKEVPFRPPFERFDIDRRSVSFIVEDGRVSFLDFEEINKQLQKALAGKSGMVSINFDLPESDFRIEGKASGQKAALKVVRRAGAAGEGLAEAEKENSRFRQTIARLSPKEVIVNFNVYPDSFDEFRSLRQIVWDGQFDLGWHPKKSGDVIELSYGSGGGYTQ